MLKNLKDLHQQHKLLQTYLAPRNHGVDGEQLFEGCRCRQTSFNRKVPPEIISMIFDVFDPRMNNTRSQFFASYAEDLQKSELRVVKTVSLPQSFFASLSNKLAAHHLPREEFPQCPTYLGAPRTQQICRKLRLICRFAPKSRVQVLVCEACREM